jgi:hypothetical protein
MVVLNPDHVSLAHEPVDDLGKPHVGLSVRGITKIVISLHSLTSTRTVSAETHR